MIKVPNVQRVKTRFGTVNLYFRMGDYREGPLKSADGTQELMDEVNAIKARLQRAADAHKRPKTGTVGGILATYNKSAEFLALARSTQREYQFIIDELAKDCDTMLLSDLTRAWVIEMRNAWAQRGHRVSDLRVQVLKNACQPIIDDDKDTRIEGDPFHNVKKAPRPHDAGEAHPIWEDHEVYAAIDAAIEKGQAGLARAIALARFGGFRRGTACKMPLGARIIGYDDDGTPHRRLYWITEKRRVLCDKREDARLTAVMDRTLNQTITIAYNSRNQPWKERQLNQALDRLMARLAKAGKVRAATDDDGEVYCPLTIHGLRHSRGVELAHAGASDAEIMGQLEQLSPAAAQEYRRQANRRRMADSAQDKVDNVVKLRAGHKAKRAAEL
ncbi:site-specific integrase [Asticcacaulis sp.]|uniref:site-specific integrase n=1 Tax=Asticcacaulis sp. TaxID=1872648 RepID=UPI00261CE00F|nr:site-specific integrase [Asticcacaulis sp.]